MNNLLFSLNDFIKNMSDTLGIWYLIILNAFGVIAIILKVSEVQIKSRKTILLFALVADICWVIYFGLQGGFSSSISCFIMMIQVIVFSFRGKYKWATSKIWLIVFIISHLVMWYITQKTWFDVLPAITGILSVFAYFVYDEDKYRILIFIYALIWVVNSSINLYVVSIISDSLCAVSSFVAIVRYNILKTHKKGVISHSDIDND